MAFFRAVRRLGAKGPDRGPEMLMPGGLTVHSARGGLSSATLRDKYYMHFKMTTDPFLQDFFFKRSVHQMCNDPSCYGLYGLCSVAWGICVGICARHFLFNPDVYFRRQENLKPMPDRHRQWTYAMPYFNHNLKNRLAGWRWIMIDNEPDYIDAHPGGLRPYRQQNPVAPWSILRTTESSYAIDDPMMTTCSYKNMKMIYAKAGYAHKDMLEEE
jgi:hypothetical protein